LPCQLGRRRDRTREDREAAHTGRSHAGEDSAGALGRFGSTMLPRRNREKGGSARSRLARRFGRAHRTLLASRNVRGAWAAGFVSAGIRLRRRATDGVIERGRGLVPRTGCAAPAARRQVHPRPTPHSRLVPRGSCEHASTVRRRPQFESFRALPHRDGRRLRGSVEPGPRPARDAASGPRRPAGRRARSRPSARPRKARTARAAAGACDGGTSVRARRVQPSDAAQRALRVRESRRPVSSRIVAGGRPTREDPLFAARD